MTITINFNNQVFQISSLPTSFASLKQKIIQQFGNQLPTSHFDLSFRFINNLNKPQSSSVSSEGQYQFLPRLMSKNTQNIDVEIIPQFTHQEKRNIVTIEDERTLKTCYINCAQEPKMEAKYEARPQERTSVDNDGLLDKAGTNLTHDPSSTVKHQTHNKPQLFHNHHHHHHRHNHDYDNDQEDNSHSNDNLRKSVNYGGFRCDNCQRQIGSFRYHSTGVPDFDLCNSCVQTVPHSYSFVEYVDGKPTREVVGPKPQQRHSFAPKHSYGSSYKPRTHQSAYESPFEGFPGFGRRSHHSFFDF